MMLTSISLASQDAVAGHHSSHIPPWVVVDIGHTHLALVEEVIDAVVVTFSWAGVIHNVLEVRNHHLLLRTHHQWPFLASFSHSKAQHGLVVHRSFWKMIRIKLLCGFEISLHLLSIQSSTRVSSITRIFKHDKCKSWWITCNPNIGQGSIISKCFFKFMPSSIVT